MSLFFVYVLFILLHLPRDNILCLNIVYMYSLFYISLHVYFDGTTLQQKGCATSEWRKSSYWCHRYVNKTNNMSVVIHDVFPLLYSKLAILFIHMNKASAVQLEMRMSMLH